MQKKGTELYGAQGVTPRRIHPFEKQMVKEIINHDTTTLPQRSLSLQGNRHIVRRS